MKTLGTSVLRRSLGGLVVGLLAAATLTAPTEAAARSDRHRPPPERIALPDGFRPEGIEARGSTAYVGSLANGDIWAADTRTGKGRVVSTGDGTPAVGLELGRAGQLWAAGGNGGDVKVVDLRTGRATTYPLAPAGTGTFINDVVVTGRTAWVTDSLQAALFEVTPGKHGRKASVTRLPLTGEWQQVPGVNNANGIETTPDGRALLVVQSSTGFLFRVDPRTGRATRVDLGATVLTNGDGLLREGRTLWAVQNRLNQVAELTLSRDGRSGRLVDTVTSPDFDVPTTVARIGRGLYLPNARFTTPPTPETEYWITRVPG